MHDDAPPVGRAQTGWRVTRKNALMKPVCAVMDITVKGHGTPCQLERKEPIFLTMFRVILEYHV